MIGKWPARGWIGFGLVGVCWPLNWTLPGIRTSYLFFPLWLGYILLVDALVFVRAGSSIWSRSRKDFLFLFCSSIPAWWLFELINWRTGNWEYLGREFFTTLQFNLLATIAFSTVIPAVFETAGLVYTFRWMDRLRSWPRWPATRGVFAVMFVAGVTMLIALLIWPKVFYPFVWLSLVFILEPVNYGTGRPHFLQRLRQGDWRTIVSLSLGAMMCGFFWEMWNYYSFPKWIYRTPGAEFWKVFEMPLLGYGGYIPFGLELYAFTNLIWRSDGALRGGNK